MKHLLFVVCAGVMWALLIKDLGPMEGWLLGAAILLMVLCVGQELQEQIEELKGDRK